MLWGEYEVERIGVSNFSRVSLTLTEKLDGEKC